MSAKLVTELLGEKYRVEPMRYRKIRREPVLLIFSKKVIEEVQVSHSFESFDRWLGVMSMVAYVVMGVCRGDILQKNLELRKRFNPKEIEPLKPGECYVMEDHGDVYTTEEDHKVIFPSRNLETVIGYITPRF